MLRSRVIFISMTGPDDNIQYIIRLEWVNPYAVGG